MRRPRPGLGEELVRVHNRIRARLWVQIPYIITHELYYIILYYMLGNIIVTPLPVTAVTPPYPPPVTGVMGGGVTKNTPLYQTDICNLL